MRAVIISNGNIDNYEYYKNKIKKDDYVICADGAIRHCVKMSIIPDLWIGDFDSCNLIEYCEKYPNLNSVSKITLNPQKDETDTHYACNIAIEKGCNEIVIWGGLGKRMDHTLANINLLEFLTLNNVMAYIEDEKNTIRIIKDCYTVKKNRKYLSLIPMDKNVTVKNATGLFYPLESYTMDRYLSLGISNEITKEYATINIENGTMLCIESDD